MRNCPFFARACRDRSPPDFDFDLDYPHSRIPFPGVASQPRAMGRNRFAVGRQRWQSTQPLRGTQPEPGQRNARRGRRKRPLAVGGGLQENGTGMA